MAGLGGFVPPVIVEVQAMAGEAIAEFKAVNGELASMQAHAEATGASLSRLEKSSAIASQAFKVLGLTTVAFGVLSVKAAMESEVEFARLNQSLKNVGDGSADTAEEMKKVAEANAKNGYSAGQTAHALGTLVTATGNTEDATRVMGLAMDVARKQHISLSDASDQLAKAMQGRLGAAFKENGISLDSTLPKQQAINKAFDQLSQKVSGQNAAYLNTFNGSLSKLGAAAENVADQVGTKLIPIIQSAANFLTRWGGDLVTLAGIIAGIVIGMKAWEAATTAYLAVNAYLATAVAADIANAELLAAQTALAGTATETLTVAEGELLLVLPEATGAMALFSAAMDANPIGLMVLGVAALVGALIGLKKVYDSYAKPGSKTSFGDKTGHWVTVGRGTPVFVPDKIQPKPKIETNTAGPRGGTPGLQGHDPYAWAGYDLTGYGGVTSPPKIITGKTPAQIAAEKAKKEREKAAAELKKDQAHAKKIYGEMSATVADYGKKYDDLVIQHAKRDTAAQTAHDDQIKTLTRDTKQELFRLERDHNDQVDKLNRAHDEAYASARAAFDYSEKQASSKHKDALLKIESDYNTKVADLNAKAAEQRKAIIQKSINELTTAWQNGTKFSLSNIEKGTFLGGLAEADATSIATQLQTQLAKVVKLQADAGALASRGFSQSFIEQIVSQGPEVGDQMSQAILNGTPETVAQIQSLYNQLNSVSTHGLDALGAQMSTSTNLATQELTDAYAQIGVDLQTALTNAHTDMVAATQQENNSFSETLASLQHTLDDALASADRTLHDGLADADKSYKDALFDAKTRFDNSVEAIDKALKDAIAASQDEFNKSVTSLHDDTIAKLHALQTELKVTAAQIADLAGKSASVQVLAGSPAAGYLAGTDTLTPNPGVPYLDPVWNVNLVQHNSATGINMADPNAWTNMMKGVSAPAIIPPPLAPVGATR